MALQWSAAWATLAIRAAGHARATRTRVSLSWPAGVRLTAVYFELLRVHAAKLTHADLRGNSVQAMLCVVTHDCHAPQWRWAPTLSVEVWGSVASNADQHGLIALRGHAAREEGCCALWLSEISFMTWYIRLMCDVCIWPACASHTARCWR
jgi:hypothetical protein